MSSFSAFRFTAAFTVLAVVATCAASTVSGPLVAADVRPVVQITSFDDWITACAIAPNGSSVVGGTDGYALVWDIPGKQERFRLETPGGFVKSAVFSPDGTRLATGSFQTVSIWNMSDGTLERRFKGHGAYVTALAFTPDGRELLSGGDDQYACRWQVADGKKLWESAEFDYPVNGLAISPDGKLVAAALGDEARLSKPGPVVLWDRETGKQVAQAIDHTRSATDIAYAPDGAFLASTSLDERVIVYESPSLKPAGFFGGHGRATRTVAFLAGGKLVVSGSGGQHKGGNDVRIWNRETGEELALLEGHDARISDVAVAEDRLLATAGYDKSLIVWDIAGLTGASTPVAETAAANSVVASAAAAAVAATEAVAKDEKTNVIKIGIIGLDTSHAPAFAKILNDPEAAEDVSGCRVVAVYPKGSPDIESSTSRVPKYTEDLKALGAEVMPSIDALVEKVDAVLLETNDGRPHLEQVLPALKAGKPVFIDKPISGSLADAVAIFEAAKHYGVPVFSSSSLRYAPGAQALRAGEHGKILGCDAYSPCSLEPTHPDLYWYGIHGVETLFTVMGSGCVSVSRTHTEGFDLAVGQWDDGRIGTFRGIRQGKSGYGGTAYTDKGIVPVGPYGGYRPLVVEIVGMFRGGDVPISAEETLQIYAFMSAADESLAQGGAHVKLEDVLEAARQEAKERLKELGVE